LHCAAAVHQVTEFLLFVESERDRSGWRVDGAGGRDGPPGWRGPKPGGETRGWHVGGTQEAFNTLRTTLKYTQYHQKVGIGKL
jgi:hypothetical protein